MPKELMTYRRKKTGPCPACILALGNSVPRRVTEATTDLREFGDRKLLNFNGIHNCRFHNNPPLLREMVTSTRLSEWTTLREV